MNFFIFHGKFIDAFSFGVFIGIQRGKNVYTILVCCLFMDDGLVFLVHNWVIT